MSLPSKLQKWVDASLITPDQRDAILTHEKSGSGNLLKRGMGYLAVFSILLGIAQIVASNWQDIPDAAKLGAHFLINITLATMVFIWRDNPARSKHRETAVFALWGLSLTLIALIGQVFQLSSDAFAAFRLWFWITTPMILYFAQGRYLTILWAVFFVIYVPGEIIDLLIVHVADPNKRIATGAFIAMVMPISIWLLGIWPRLQTLRPALTHTLRNIGFILAVFTASAASIGFYIFPDMQTFMFHRFGTILNDPTLLRMAAVAGGVVAFALAYTARKRFALDQQQSAITDIFLLCAVMAVLPFVMFVANDMMAMLHVIFLWLGIGYISQRSGGMESLVNLSILVITIRLFIGFLEIFGSLMNSGLGFIIIGLVLMALLYGARTVKRNLKEGRA